MKIYKIGNNKMLPRRRSKLLHSSSDDGPETKKIGENSCTHRKGPSREKALGEHDTQARTSHSIYNK